MRKIVYCALMLIGVVSCAKDNSFIEEQETEAIQFVCAANNDSGTKTVIGSNGKTDWVINDEVTITTGTTSKVYYVSSVNDDGSANLTIKSGTAFTAAGTYTASYGSLKTEQFVTDDGCGVQYPLITDATSVPKGEVTVHFHFKNNYAAFSVSVNGAENIAKIKLISQSTDHPTNYSATFSKPVATMSSSKRYMIAAEPNVEYKVQLVKADGRLSELSGTTIQASLGGLEKVNISGAKYTTDSRYSGDEPIPLTGVFSVSSTKKVRFAKGNLYYDGSSFKFETDPTYCPLAYDATHVSHFWWQPLIADAVCQKPTGKAPHSYSYTAHCFAYNGGAIPGYTVINNAERDYLMARKTKNDNNKLLYYTSKGATENENWVKIGDTRYNACLLYPDDYNYTTTTPQYQFNSFEELESYGIVFLPWTHGYRTSASNGASLDNTNLSVYFIDYVNNSNNASGFYWDKTSEVAPLTSVAYSVNMQACCFRLVQIVQD